MVPHAFLVDRVDVSERSRFAPQYPVVGLEQKRAFSVAADRHDRVMLAILPVERDDDAQIVRGDTEFAEEKILAW